MVVRFMPTRVPEQPTVQSESASGETSAACGHAERLAEVVHLRTQLVPEEQEPTSLPATPPELPVFDKAVRLLARRALSSQELVNELMKSGYSAAECEDVVTECEARLYLDDAALAQRLVEKAETRKRMSRTMLNRLLRERLIPEAIVNETLLELSGETEEANMLALARERASKLGSLDRTTAQRRLTGYLARRGFGGASLHRIVRQALETPDSPQ